MHLATVKFPPNEALIAAGKRAAKFLASQMQRIGAEWSGLLLLRAEANQIAANDPSEIRNQVVTTSAKAEIK